MLPSPIENRIKSIVSTHTGTPVPTLRTKQATGGSINQAASVFSEGMKLFVKWNDALKFPEMFEAEAKGLSLLKTTGGAHVPEVLETGTIDTWSYILMTNIERTNSNPASEEQFGIMLSEVHRNTSTFFGLDHDNYMGSIPQHNKPHNHWCDFFINERLLPQLITAINDQWLPASDEKHFDRLFNKLPDILPVEPPSLVHGDLWSGNYITGTQNKTWLIDPAIAYAHREVDIAMTYLFGGFSPQFYQAYHRQFPLEPGWQSRLKIFQLYPLLIHVHLFGGGYVNSVRSIIQKF